MTHAATSWIYLFSKFTSEALLFESLLICLLVASYAAFYVLKKRPYGVIDQEVPAGVVKGYLNELMMDAEQLRAQLFGLLATQGAPAAYSAGQHANFQPTLATSSSSGLPPAEFQQKMSSLELKMSEQSKALETMVSEKRKIEAELAAAKTGGASATSGAPSADLSKLQTQIKLLETKLAEYSVIEDDLANLKRLQQENTQLKTALKNAGASVVAAPQPQTSAAVTPVAAMETAAKSVTELEAAPAASLESASADEIFGTVEPAAAKVVETAPAPAAAATSHEPVAEPAFEGLVDQVEQSLKTEAPTSAESSTSATPAPTIEKSDADLVAEFEKMLNG